MFLKDASLLPTLLLLMALLLKHLSRHLRQFKLSSKNIQISQSMINPVILFHLFLLSCLFYLPFCDGGPHGACHRQGGPISSVAAFESFFWCQRMEPTATEQISRKLVVSMAICLLFYWWFPKKHIFKLLSKKNWISFFFSEHIWFLSCQLNKRSLNVQNI